MPGIDGKISLSLASKRGQQNGVKRSRAALDEDDPHDREHGHGKVQNVSHFDTEAGGAIDEARPKQDVGPMVIAPQANRDWKEAANGSRKRQKSGIPNGQSDADQAAREREVEAAERAKKLDVGLNIRTREPAVTAVTNSKEQSGGEVTESSAIVTNSSKSRTIEEQAIDALLNKEFTSDLVVPALDEDEVLQRDIKDAPEMASLDDYERVPVEHFGAAMLRGMGWKEGEGIGSQKGRKLQSLVAPKSRPALLGIGAKEEAAISQELGAWGKAARKGGEVKIYNPVLLRDKTTGEMLTEEELQKKREKAERDQYEREFEEKKRRADRSDARDREGDRSRDDKRSRDGDYDRRHKERDDRRRDRRREDEYRDKHSSHRRDRSRDDQNRSRDDDRRKDTRSRDDRHEDSRDGRRHLHDRSREKDRSRYR